MLRNIVLLTSCLLLAACSGEQATYAEDRALVENLYARYVFAADWQDADTYAAIFTEDGILDWAGGVIEGREGIRSEVHNMRSNFAEQEARDAPLRPARLRHFITSIVLDVQGSEANARAFWVEFDNRNPERRAYSGAYGHSEDRLRKVDGEWLFTFRKIYNEQMPERSAPMQNPAW
jgi:triphosphoribosyl-dephospho-CoA synthetase